MGLEVEFLRPLKRHEIYAKMLIALQYNYSNEYDTRLSHVLDYNCVALSCLLTLCLETCLHFPSSQIYITNLRSPLHSWYFYRAAILLHYMYRYVYHYIDWSDRSLDRYIYSFFKFVRVVHLLTATSMHFCYLYQSIAHHSLSIRTL